MSSKLADLVEEEARKAEAEDDPETAGAREVPEGVDPETGEIVRQQIPPSSVTELEKHERALKAEDTRHENALKKLYGEAWEDFAFCPLCLGQGFTRPHPEDSLPEEVWEAIQALAGKTPHETYRTASYAQVCQECGGWGKVLTGAKNENQAALPCKKCDARGWFDTEDLAHRAKLGIPAPGFEPAPAFPVFHTPPVQHQEPGHVPPPPANWHVEGKPGADQWDRWPGHPRYGIDPQHGGW